MSRSYRPSVLHARTRSGPEVGIDETLQFFPKTCVEISQAFPDSVPFIDHDATNFALVFIILLGRDLCYCFGLPI